MIAIGTSDTFPLASILRIATARGPASFLRPTLFSPGTICGRSSCAAAVTTETMQVSNAVSAAHKKILRCRILKILGSLKSAVAVPDLPFSGELSMKVNDKAPDFTLQDENEKQTALKDFRGKTVVLFFYPKANTPG